jgi:alkanesulfonate monooxygenase SsuD/methylene tetrahydromethanopterin reductase-like flavin-dependent oxidoreductase (luciferase family)
MEFGAHLPLMDFGGNPYTLDWLIDYASTARRLGFSALAANDHMVFATPWLDGPTALPSVIAVSGEMDLATTVSLPVVRGPVQLAKTLGAVDRLSGGRMLVAVGPGSSQGDYEAVGVEFDERWPRLDEAVMALRTLWNPEAEPFHGRFYSTVGIKLLPEPARPGGPPIWIGSWGSDAGLRRTARIGDGWLASAYNTTPDGFAESWSKLRQGLEDTGRDVAGFPNGLATMWFYITDDAIEAERVLTERVVPTIHRPEKILRDRLPIGSPDGFAEKLDAFRTAGVQRVYIWPVADETNQLRLFQQHVAPQLT